MMISDSKMNLILFCLFLFLLINCSFHHLILRSIIKAIGGFIFLFQLAGVLSNQILHLPLLCKRFVPVRNRLVLVTGCDSGFGLSTAKRLDKRGFYVLAGVLSKESEGCKYLDTHASAKLHTIKLDVTKQEDVDDVMHLVAYLTDSHMATLIHDQKNAIFDTDGSLELWALINNAGIAQFTPIEFGTVDRDLKPMFEVNVFGALRMTKAMLPFLRRSRGRIVNIGSVCDRQTISGLTGYSMSKFALRSLTDGLRQEMDRFRIKSILIEPTLYKTPISNADQLITKFNQTFDRTARLIVSDYGEKYQEEFTTHLNKMIILTRTNIDEVVNSIEDAVLNVIPREQYWCASGLQKILFWFIEQFSIHITDMLCTWQPPQWLVHLAEKINNNS